MAAPRSAWTGGAWCFPPSSTAHPSRQGPYLAPRRQSRRQLHGRADHGGRRDREANWTADDVRAPDGFRPARRLRPRHPRHPHPSRRPAAAGRDLLPGVRRDAPALGRPDRAAGRLPRAASTARDAAGSHSSTGVVAEPAACSARSPTRSPTSRTARPFFRLPIEHGLAVDFHVDETGDGRSPRLRMHRRSGAAGTASTARLRSAIAARSPCSRGAEADARSTSCAKAGLRVVSLPMCNLYLQDRRTAAARRAGAA